jgi:hypothetical protein
MNDAADKPSANAFPGCYMPVIYMAHDGKAVRAMKVRLTVRWGAGRGCPRQPN